MSEISGNLTACEENSRVTPDFFGFYTSEIAELLSQDEGLLPFPHPVPHLAENLHEVGREKVSNKNTCRAKENIGISGSAPLFSNGIGALLSEFKTERLKSLLRQSVFTLTQEVDEMIDPVLSVCRLRSWLGCKNIHLGPDVSVCKAEIPQPPQKKLKVLPALSDLKREHMNLAVSRKELSNDVAKKCSECHSIKTPQWRHGPDGTKSLCNGCGLRYAKKLKNVSSMNSDTDADKESAEIDDDLRFLLENDRGKVEELMKKHSDGFSATLNHMEQKLEELLNILMTSCRPMTIAEKQHLCKLIQNLPPKNLDRVVEIIRHDKPSERDSCDQVHVDLDAVENVTLWRLYFYVTTIQGSNTL